ncbi:MAG: ArnT family glycosyltransferase [Ignavibacteria bacterium]
MLDKLKNFYSDNRSLSWLGIINFILVYVSSFTPGYGYFIDEFYYIACSNHPALGYVDQPPLAPLLLMVYKFIFGASVYSIRILPAIAFSVTIIFTGLIAKQYGGNKSAQFLSALCLMCSPIYPAMCGFYSMNAFEPLLAVIVYYILLKQINDGNPKHWIAIGILFGIALMNKHTAGLYIALIPVCLLFSRQRKILFNRWFVFCVLISALIFLPDILWNVFNGYPTFEFYRNITLYKNVPAPPVQFMLNQVLAYSPFAFPFWLGGAIFLIFGKDMKKFRFAGYLFFIVFIFFMLTRTSRMDRLAFAYPLVIPAGAILFEKIKKYKFFGKIHYAVYSLLILWLIAIIPLLSPYLGYGETAFLTKTMGMKTELERGNKPLISQTIADRIGWEEKVDMVGSVYKSVNDTLPPALKNKVAVFAENYGMAGAVDLYGKEKYGINKVICAHNNYYFWSKQMLENETPEYIIAISHAGNYDDFKESFYNVDSTGLIFDNIYCTPHERNLTVFICSKPKRPQLELLDNGRFFY